jgi:hypothetical protein
VADKAPKKKVTVSKKAAEPTVKKITAKSKTASDKNTQEISKKAEKKPELSKSDKKPVTKKKTEEKPAVQINEKKAAAAPVKTPPVKVSSPAVKAVKKKPEINEEIVDEKEGITIKTVSAVKKQQLSSEESKIEAAKYYPPIEKKNVKQYEASKAIGQLNEGELDNRYHDDKLVLMARDPYWCYAYWDISANLLQERGRLVKDEWGHHWMVLRVYDITDIDFNGTNAQKFMDISVTGDANNWYINVWEAGKRYLAELGYKTSKGHFIAIARSNAIGTPRDTVSNIVDEEWMVVDEDFDEIFRMSGGGKKPLGASEREKFPEIMSPEFLSSRGGSAGVSSFSMSSPTGGAPPKRRGFWLVADTELILYGATERDARVTVKGEPVKLETDGSFSLRFHLPDGVQDLPVEATSSDGIDTITIKIKVERTTK